MPRFIEIRGGTGVGKSTLVRAVMHDAMGRTVSHEEHLWIGFLPPIIAVPGSYRMKTGGLENRYSSEEIVLMLDTARKAAKNGIVLFEGGLISKSTGEVFKWLAAQEDYRIVYLDLPLEKTVRNLTKRRGREIERVNPIANDHKRVREAVGRAAHWGVPVETAFSYQEALKITMQLITESR